MNTEDLEARQNVLRLFAAPAAININTAEQSTRFAKETLRPADLRKLAKHPAVASPAEVFALTSDQWQKVVGHRRVEEVVQGVERARQRCTAARAIASLVIPGLGPKAAEALAQQDDILVRLPALGFKELASLRIIGTSLARAIVAFFQGEESYVRKDHFQRLEKYGVSLKRVFGQAGQALKGEVVIVTGTVPGHSRSDLNRLVRENGGEVGRSSINGKTTLVVAGDAPGPNKIAQAEELGLPVISAADFLKIIGEEA